MVNKLRSRKELMGEFLFFPKNEGKKINKKLDDILKNQKDIKNEITEISIKDSDINGTSFLIIFKE